MGHNFKIKNVLDLEINTDKCIKLLFLAENHLNLIKISFVATTEYRSGSKICILIRLKITCMSHLGSF